MSTPPAHPAPASPGGTEPGGPYVYKIRYRSLKRSPDGRLDEPSEGLAPLIVQQISLQIRRLQQSGTSILLAEQNMHFCLHIASHVAVIDKGHIVNRNTAQALRGDDEIKWRYLSV